MAKIVLSVLGFFVLLWIVFQVCKSFLWVRRYNRVIHFDKKHEFGFFKKSQVHKIEMLIADISTEPKLRSIILEAGSNINSCFNKGFKKCSYAELDVVAFYMIVKAKAEEKLQLLKQAV